MSNMEQPGNSASLSVSAVPSQAIEGAGSLFKMPQHLAGLDKENVSTWIREHNPVLNDRLVPESFDQNLLRTEALTTLARDDWVGRLGRWYTGASAELGSDYDQTVPITNGIRQLAYRLNAYGESFSVGYESKGKKHSVSNELTVSTAGQNVFVTARSESVKRKSNQEIRDTQTTHFAIAPNGVFLAETNDQGEPVFTTLADIPEDKKPKIHNLSELLHVFNKIPVKDFAHVEIKHLDPTMREIWWSAKHDVLQNPAYNIPLGALAVGTQVLEKSRYFAHWVLPPLAIDTFNSTHSPWLAGFYTGLGFFGYSGPLVGGGMTETYIQGPTGVKAFNRRFPWVIGNISNMIAGKESSLPAESRPEDMSKTEYVARNALPTVARRMVKIITQGPTVAGLGTAAIDGYGASIGENRKQLHARNINAAVNGAAFVCLFTVGLGEFMEYVPSAREVITEVFTNGWFWYGVSGTANAIIYSHNYFNKIKPAKLATRLAMAREIPEVASPEMAFENAAN